MVDIKLIHYDNGIIIECIDEKNARAVVPSEYLKRIQRINIPAHEKSPLTYIIKHLEHDFNFCNLGNYKYTHYENEKALYYNFHREIIE